MCMGPSAPAPAPTPAAAPPPAPQPPVAPVINETTQSQRNTVNAARNGSSAFRVDLSNGGPTGGTGLNIPV